MSALLTAALLFVQPAPAVDWKTLALDTYPPDARAQIASARDAAIKQPQSADAAGQVALTLHAWDQFELAAAAYADARRLAPQSVDWWVLSGILASRMGRHDLAAEFFGKAESLAPSPLLLLRHADALLESGQLEAAQVAYEAAVKLPDAEPGARYGLGRIANSLGDVASARTHLERAVALVPNFGAAHYALAQLQRKAGDLAAARMSIAMQQRCLTCWPMPADPWAARLAEVRTDAAAVLRRGLAAAGTATGDAQAIALHEEALARRPDLLQARINLITLYARTGNLAAAERHYRAAVATGTQLAEAHQAFGLALATAGESAKAEPVLRLAVAANPLDAASHNALGLICETSGRPADAESAYRLAVEADPRTRIYRFNHARVLVNSGRLDEALAELSRLRSPDDAESARYVFAAAAVHVRKGDLATARQLSEDALARAQRYGLKDLAAAIERDLAKIR